MAITIGIDPGFANIGLAIVDVTESGIELKDLKLLSTKKDPNAEYVAEDNNRRGKEIYNFLKDMATHWDAKSFAVERMSFPRNASTAAKTALFWGILLAISEELNIPIVSISSQLVKTHVGGVRTAGKRDIIEALRKRFPEALVGKKFRKSSLEHIYDALGNVLTIVENPKAKVSIC